MYAGGPAQSLNCVAVLTKGVLVGGVDFAGSVRFTAGGKGTAFRTRDWPRDRGREIMVTGTHCRPKDLMRIFRMCEYCFRSERLYSTR